MLKLSVNIVKQSQRSVLLNVFKNIKTDEKKQVSPSNLRPFTIQMEVQPKIFCH